jgi:2,4-dienoyl-CoA reductase-like NADH-dependent reductase (Old Yellow Enzyme family)
MIALSSFQIGNVIIKNRIIRSATFEGMCDNKGFPKDEYFQYYNNAARSGVGAIITGFAYISEDGRAIHPGQAGIDSEEKIESYSKLTKSVHKHDCKIFMQIAHTGRQTKEKYTGEKILAPYDKKSFYFKDTPKIIPTDLAYKIAEDFAISASYAMNAGFDGVQIHAAHGYLIHQFIMPATNLRRDEFGIDEKTRIGTKFLGLVIDRIKKRCGEDFPILVKLSGGDDYGSKFTKRSFDNLVKFLNGKNIQAVEVSYGTMDYAMNIFRGGVPMKEFFKYSPLFNKDNSFFKRLRNYLLLPKIQFKTKKFEQLYNLEYAKIAKRSCDVPVILVGGVRSGREIESCIESDFCDFLAMARPFLCEPDFIKKLEQNEYYVSRCTNCNKCVIMCDSGMPTRCYYKK